MIAGRRVLAVVPARGGSKGIPLKNLREVNGVSLIALVGRVIHEIPAIDRAVVSTDHEEIARVSEAAGIGAPFRRPEALSGDRIGDQPVLEHALHATEEMDGVQYDIIVMLQPTSPLRRADEVTGAMELLVTEEWDAVWTVSETELRYHPWKQLVVEEDGALQYYDSRGANVIARQQLQPLFHRNGIAYVVTRDCLLRSNTLHGARTRAFIVPGEHISIDTEEDLIRVEEILSQQGK